MLNVPYLMVCSGCLGHLGDVRVLKWPVKPCTPKQNLKVLKALNKPIRLLKALHVIEAQYTLPPYYFFLVYKMFFRLPLKYHVYVYKYKIITYINTHSVVLYSLSIFIRFFTPRFWLLFRCLRNVRNPTYSPKNNELNIIIYYILWT